MILAQIALAEQALGRFVVAEQHLLESLAAQDSWIELHRATLGSALLVIQSRLSWLEITSNAPAAELWLDDQPRKLASSPFRVAAGSHTLRLRSTLGTEQTRTVELGPGERHVYRLELVEAPTAAPVLAPRAPVTEPIPRKRASSEPNRTVRTWAYATATVAGIALVEAVAASLLRKDYVDDYNSPSCAPDRSQRCAAYRSSASTFGTIAVAGYAIAGVAGLASLTLFAEPWWNQPGARPSSALVGFGGTF